MAFCSWPPDRHSTPKMPSRLRRRSISRTCFLSSLPSPGACACAPCLCVCVLSRARVCVCVCVCVCTRARERADGMTVGLLILLRISHAAPSRACGWTLTHLTMCSWYAYEGSLSRPPCSEGVQWLVSPSIIPVPRTLIAQLKVINGGQNSRAAQPLDGRHVELLEPRSPV